MGEELGQKGLSLALRETKFVSICKDALQANAFGLEVLTLSEHRSAVGTFDCSL